MTCSNAGPYRATALWNDAVILFRDNLPLHEHRHRLHKHRNSFSGHGAVSFLHHALRSNPLFNPDVTREQACQLLKQFLKADLITPVQNCSIGSNKQTFHDSHKYLYEFTEKLINFQRLTPLSTKVINESNPNIFSGNDSQKENVLNIDNEKSWKLAVIQRTIELLKPCDVSELITLKEINPKWVATNANPEWNKIKWNTELPHWILSTMQQLLKYTSKDYCDRAYPSFQMDAFKVICDYYKTLEQPIILQCFYKIYIDIYNYLNNLNNIDNTNNHEMIMSSSQEDLIFKISSPLKPKIKRDISLQNNLPPNHCYEAAFISDDPTFRVVPQSSVDSIHLQNRNISEFKINQDFTNNVNNMSNKLDDINERKKTSKPKFKKTPLNSWDSNSCNKSYNDIKTGFVNEAFAIFSPQKFHKENKCSGSTKYKSNDCLNTKSFSYASDNINIKRCTTSYSGYVNHGLSFSLEDVNLLTNDRLDYSYALETLDKLMKVTKYNISTSDDEYSFYTAHSSSETDFSELSQDSLLPLEVQWNDRVIHLGVTVFQLLLMLLPPCNRAQLKNLSVLINEVSNNTSSPGLSLQNMLQKLNESILRPNTDETFYEAPIVNKILSFIVKNHAAIFTDLPSELLSVITNEIYEHQLHALSYCKQITEKQFEQQKSEESSFALNQLLDHLVNNSAISEKERKKHLKVFKESYPAIYKARFPSESSTSKSKTLFSFKNFRL